MSAHDVYVAIMGIVIVFTSLCLLSVIIHLLPSALELWDNKAQMLVRTRTGKGTPLQQPADEMLLPLSAPEEDMARQFYLLTRRLGDPFALPRLLYLAENLGIQRPYASLAKLLTSHYVLPDKTGFYRWNEKAHPRV